jgi:hypothetical protein
MIWQSFERMPLKRRAYLLDKPIQQALGHYAEDQS